MSDAREKLEQLPPRLENVGIKLLNWVDHTNWEARHHAEEALVEFAEEVLRLRAHLGRREQYLLDETAIHPNLAAPTGGQFGHARHADTCSMCADDVKVFANLRDQYDRAEQGRLTYISGAYRIQKALGNLKVQDRLGEKVPTAVELADILLKELERIGQQHQRAVSK